MKVQLWWESNSDILCNKYKRLTFRKKEREEIYGEIFCVINIKITRKIVKEDKKNHISPYIIIKASLTIGTYWIPFTTFDCPAEHTNIIFII